MKKRILILFIIIVISLLTVFYSSAITIKPGDVNNDGIVTAADARLVLQVSAKLGVFSNSYAYAAANVDNDDRITAADARMVLRISAKLENIEDREPKSVSGFSVLIKQNDSSESTEIKLTNQNGNYYLYLPANVDKSQMIFTFDDGVIVKIDNTNIYSNEVSSALEGKDKFALFYDGMKYNVQICQSENIPALFISTESNSMSNVHANQDYKEPGKMVLINADSSEEYSGALDYIKGRGNSSWKYAKKGYNIKLDKSTDLCGLGKTKKWSLIPNHIDKSLLRNQIIYDLADAIGLEYSPASTPVDLYLNGQYNGTYLLVVKNDVDSAAVNISDLAKATEKVNENELDTYSNIVVNNSNGLVHYKYNNIPNDPSDITGGYLLELDHSSYNNEASGFTTSKGQRVVIKAPEYATKAQVEYIGKWFQAFEDAVYSQDGYNSEGKHYTEYIDLESFAKYYLLSEIAMNGDSHITSVFMYKESDIDGDGLLHAGPVWDYDSSLGNNGGKKSFDVTVTLTNPAQQFYSVSKIYKGNNVDFIYAALYKHSDFRTAVVECYKNDVQPALNVLLGDDAGEMNRLKNYDEYVSVIEQSATMNFVRWNIMSNSMTGTQTGTTYEKNIQQLYNFLKDKKSFMDKIIDAYYENYLYIFVDGENIYGVTSFESNTVELYKGSIELNSVIKHGGKEFTVVSKK